METESGVAMTKTRKMPIRLALRHEGQWWNAYMALPDTMEGAKLIGSILIGAARDEKIKRAFMDVMTATMAVAIKDVTGKYPDEWHESDAPPHEKAGHS